MSTQVDDNLLLRAARRVADYLGEHGHAYVEDVELASLVKALRLFLTESGVQINPAGTSGTAPTEY